MVFAWNSFVLVCPDPGVSVSGGHLFNRFLLEEACKAQFPLSARRFEGVCPSKGQLMIYDSLYLPRLLCKLSVLEKGAHALMLHGLPSEGLEMKGLEEIFQKMQFVFVPGLRFSERLRARFPNTRFVVLEPGVSEVFRPGPARMGPVSCLRLVTVANLLEGKRPLETLRLLAQAPGAWTWDWIGCDVNETNLRNEFWREVCDFGLEGRVRLRPLMTQACLHESLGAMDLMIFASREETYGMAIAEAQVMGLPVLTTDVGEAMRLVRDGVTGRVVPNELSMFGRALRETLRLPERVAAWRLGDRSLSVRRWGEVFLEFRQTLSGL